MKRMLALMLALAALMLAGCWHGIVLSRSNQGQAWVVGGAAGTYVYHCVAAGGQARCTRVAD